MRIIQKRSIGALYWMTMINCVWILRKRCSMHAIRVYTCLSKVFIFHSLGWHALSEIMLLMVLFGFISLNIAIILAAILWTLFPSSIFRTSRRVGLLFIDWIWNRMSSTLFWNIWSCFYLISFSRCRLLCILPYAPMRGVNWSDFLNFILKSNSSLTRKIRTRSIMFFIWKVATGPL